MPNTQAQSTPSIQSLDGIFNKLADAQSPGLAVLVRKNQQTLFQKTYGVTDLRTRTPLTPQTNFRLASCTKQFTAMAIMLLVHDGKLRYDESLTEIFPGFPAYGRQITIRDLLNHTSGLKDYESLMDPAVYGDDFASPPKRQISDAEVLALLESQTSGDFPPGTKWVYSNSGYVVLGAIVAKIAGQPYEDFLSARIFKPLRMSDTLAYVSGKNVVSNRAYGHSKESGAWKETDQSSTSTTLGDGGIYSSLEDLGRWDNALTNRQLLTAAETEPAFTPANLRPVALPPGSAASGQEPSPEAPVLYGFGWFLEPSGLYPHVWHYGETIGFKSAILRYNDGLTIIILANRSDLDLPSLAKKAADLYHPPAK